MIAILEKYEHNIDFHQIVDFVEASHISGNFFWQWEHITGYGKTALEEAIVLQTLQQGQLINSAVGTFLHWQWQNSSSSGNYFALPVGTSSGSGNTSLEVGKLH
nr:hypothetical protein [Tanacetum cinerariifolium]